MGNLILVIDDDEEFRRFANAALTHEGYEVIEAKDGQSAFQLLETRNPDLIIVDYMLPKMSGIEFLEKLRKFDENVRAAFVSSHLFGTVTPWSKLIENLGVSRLIQKPISEMELAVIVKSILLEEHAPDGHKRKIETVGDALVELKKDFLEHLPDRFDALRESIDRARKGDNEALSDAARVAWQLHSMAGSYRFDELSKLAGSAALILQNMADGRADGNPKAWIEIKHIVTQAQQCKLKIDDADSVAQTVSTTVLLAEVDGQTISAIEDMGRKNLVDVHVASSIVDALKLADRYSFDGAIVGAHLKERESGFELVRRLRFDHGLSALPIAVVSTDAGLGNRMAAVQAGAALFLSKPVSNADFLQTVQYFSQVKRQDQFKVLIIDDDAKYANYIAGVLVGRNHEVKAIGPSGRIMEEMQSFNPDLVLLDVIMPNVSGFDICKTIRAAPMWRQLPVIFMSSRLNKEIRLTCFRVGGDDYVEKPIMIEELLARIQSRLERLQILRDRAEKDPLTGLLNRRSFIERIQVRFAEADRKKSRVSLALLDLDRFKRVNDVYGHLTGDRVLKAFGNLLLGRFRTEDLRARWGGEEFILAFYGESARNVKEILERTLDEFSAFEFRGEGGELFTVAFSAGVAVYPDNAEKLDEVIRIADKKLYEAKQAGRKRVMI